MADAPILDAGSPTIQGANPPQARQFIPLPDAGQSSNTKASSLSSEDFKLRAKAFEPAAGAMWNVPIGISVKVLRNRVYRICQDDEQADTIADFARPSPESLKAAKEATARLLARHNVSDDAADGTIIIGCAAEIVHGFYDCLQEIRALEKKLLAKKDEKKAA